MATGTQRQGAPLRLDSANEWVWQGEQRLQLTPKAFAVLHYSNSKRPKDEKPVGAVPVPASSPGQPQGLPLQGDGNS